MKLNINVFKYECVYVKNDDTERWQSSCIYFSFSPGLLPFTHLVVKHNLHLILDHGNNIKFYISFLLWGWIYRHEKKKKEPHCWNSLLQAINQDNEWQWKPLEIPILFSQVNTYPPDHAASVRSQVHFVFEACYPLPLKRLLLIKHKSNTSKINQT